MDGLGPIKATNISHSAYDAIEGAIVRCELAPGALLSDRQLSEALGISRTPVREALQSLESSGLVKRRGRVGWMVAEFNQRDARELFELRRLLEPSGLERLSLTWEETTTQELASFFDDFPGQLPPDLYAEYLERDHEFHKRIVEWSDNTRIVHFYSVVEKQINRIRHYLAPGYEGRMGSVLEEHRWICEAIAARDLTAASSALLHHLQEGERAMTSFIGEQSTGEYSSLAQDNTHDGPQSRKGVGQ